MIREHFQAAPSSNNPAPLRCWAQQNLDQPPLRLHCGRAMITKTVRLALMHEGCACQFAIY